MSEKQAREIHSFSMTGRDARHTPTKAEKALWRVLKDRSLNGIKFQRQFTIGRYIVDFYCAEASLVVELDGPDNDSRRGAGSERQQALEAMGLKVLRFRNDEVLTDVAPVEQTILQVVRGTS